MKLKATLNIEVKDRQIDVFVNHCTQVAVAYGKTPRCREHMRLAVMQELEKLNIEIVA